MLVKTVSHKYLYHIHYKNYFQKIQAEEVVYLEINISDTRTFTIVSRANKDKNLLSEDLKQDNNNPKFEVIFANMINDYLEVLQNWIPKLVGIEEKKWNFANTNYSDRIDNLEYYNKNSIRNNKNPAKVKNIEMYSCNCYLHEIVLESDGTNKIDTKKNDHKAFDYYHKSTKIENVKKN
ncbi:hypothetical protein C2G38_2175691 [Gigaspora rosea]|uniref:Uncharacterized protein n=1 Tax=Gigaspora rosea TaxID=44941 RepID=A0A397VH03_9GLOM|nr:hypothetical protein C2G38_2175691 [Gigaspora rosea]